MPRGTPLFFHFSPLLTNVIVRPVISLDVEKSLSLILKGARLLKLDNRYEFYCGVQEWGNLKWEIHVDLHKAVK